MKSVYYYSGTIGLFVLEAILAILIPDVSIVFNFVSAIACSCIGFIFPGVFYIVAENKHCESQEVRSRNKIHRKMAYFHIVLGILIFLICTAASILNIMNNISAHS